MNGDWNDLLFLLNSLRKGNDILVSVLGADENRSVLQRVASLTSWNNMHISSANLLPIQSL